MASLRPSPRVFARLFSCPDMVRYNIEPEEFEGLCRRGARMVNLPEREAYALLWAIGHMESGAGRMVVARHEPVYCMNGPDGIGRPGRFYRGEYGFPMYKRFGCWAHCSYGPWQIMFANSWRHFGSQYHPDDIADPATALIVSVQHLNAEILGRQGAREARQIFDAWNSGDWRDRFVPETYIERALKYYQEAL